MASTLGLGVALTPDRVGAELAVPTFEATGDSILSGDGTIDAVWVDPTIVFEWVGVGADASLEWTLSASLSDVESESIIASGVESITSPSGSASLGEDAVDLLDTDGIDAEDFTVEDPDTIRDTPVSFALDASLTLDSSQTVATSATTDAIVSVERPPLPAIETFSLTDDSTPGRARVSVSWEVTDETVELETVRSDLRPLDGETVHDEQETAVEGHAASGTHDLESGELADDEYEIKLVVENTAGVTRTETAAGEGEHGGDDPQDVFAELTAAVTDTSAHGNTDRPTEVTIDFERTEDEATPVECTVSVSDATVDDSSEAMADTLLLEPDQEGPPTDEATVTVEVPDWTAVTESITAADGTVDLLDT